MTDQASDIHALRRMQAGDRSSLSELYDRYTPLMLGIALRILRNRSDAEDVLQEAWVQAWNRCASFDPARGAVGAWLVTIARTRALDRVRRNATRGRLEAETELQTRSPAANPAASAERSDMKASLVKALGALDEKQREVIEIAYFEGLSQSEIAERVGAPLGTVKYWTRQGLTKLKELVPKDAP